jgi:hypothetical protein
MKEKRKPGRHNADRPGDSACVRLHDPLVSAQKSPRKIELSRASFNNPGDFLLSNTVTPMYHRLEAAFRINFA